MAKIKTIYHNILKSISEEKKLLAVLIDPDKFQIHNTEVFLQKVNQSIATHIFVGGSTVDVFATEKLVVEIKKHSNLPVVLFPGDVTQITNHADALLFLSLVSGRNAEYLIGQHIKAVSKLRDSSLEVIPTGYVLVDGGTKTATQKVTNTESLTNVSEIADTAKASQLLGMKLIYLEAGSGAKWQVSEEIIKQVKQEISIPLIVGGGIRTKKQLDKAYQAGADLVVIGTAFEEDETFFEVLKN